MFVTFMNERRSERVVVGVHSIPLSLDLLYNILETVCIIATPSCVEVPPADYSFHECAFNLIAQMRYTSRASP
jgi:hypothetical protein